jgi:hypothetical protein
MDVVAEGNRLRRGDAGIPGPIGSHVEVEADHDGADEDRRNENSGAERSARPPIVELRHRFVEPSPS